MPPERRGRVLYADDDTQVLRAIEAVLSLSGFEVTTVESGAEVLAAMDAAAPDVLLLDINMPGNHNLELVQLLSKARPLVPVVILTGYPTLDTAVGAVRLGVVDYITKPHKIEDLLARLDLAVHQARLLRSVGEAESLTEELARRLDALKSVLNRVPGTQLSGAPDRQDATTPLDPLRNLTPGDLARLSARERDVLRELARGHSPQRIAKTLELSTNTIRNHLKSIFLKLGVNSQVALLGKLATRQP